MHFFFWRGPANIYSWVVIIWADGASVNKYCVVWKCQRDSRAVWSPSLYCSQLGQVVSLIQAAYCKSNIECVAFIIWIDCFAVIFSMAQYSVSRWLARPSPTWLAPMRLRCSSTVAMRTSMLSWSMAASPRQCLARVWRTTAPTQWVCYRLTVLFIIIHLVVILLVEVMHSDVMSCHWECSIR